MSIKTDQLPATELMDDEFYYGHRTVITYNAEGKEIYSDKPLTLDDFLNPEEGDHFMQGTLHHDDTGILTSIFRYIYRNDPSTAVFSDLKIVWGIEGLAQPAPDVTVVPHVKNLNKPRPTFKVKLEGTLPTFILEIVSPRYRQPDREKKVAIYEQAGVKEYFIVDSWLQGDQVAYEILGYRLQGDIYVEIHPDEDGWVFSEVNNVWLGVTETKTGFFVVDAETHEIILPAEKRAEAQRDRAETEAARAEAEAIARQQAEVRAAELEIQLRELQARYQTKSDTPIDQED